MDNPQKGSIFALGPAPPGHRPPNTSLFKRLEYNMLAQSRRMKDTTAKIDRLRGAHRLEISTALRLSIKEQVMLAIKDQILSRKVMTNYSLKLKALQEAEILKVVKHISEIDKNCQEMSTNLARLKVTLKQETDLDKIRSLKRDIYALSKEQKKATGLRERWRLRKVQMEAAKVKVPQPPPTNNKSVNVSTPKPRTDTKTVKVVKENIKKNSTTETKGPNQVVAENTNKNITSPKPTTDTKCPPKTVALKSKENIDKRIKLNKDCKRCAFLQRSNKNNKDFPKVCNICLKWAHKVLQDGVEITSIKNAPNNNTTASESATTATAMEEHDYANYESTIKVEIEPVTDLSIMEESVTEMDSRMTSVHVEIESLDESMNDEIMSDVIKEETETLARPDSVDFEKVTLLQDGMKAIDDKTTALAHVRLLQEYAMLNDNYRAIGLLSEVEAALINPAKNEDFEC